MFVRRKANKSGTFSIQVISKEEGHYKVVKSFGSGITEKELEQKEREAYVFIQQHQSPPLPFINESTDQKIESFLSSIKNTQFHVIGPELIFGTLYDKIGYNCIPEKLFRHLVVCRLFNPGSKLKTIDYLLRYQNISYSVDQIYYFLDKLCQRKQGKVGIKEIVEHISFEHTKRVLGQHIDVVFYDMTTLYFEASDEDDLRKTGFSKDGKHSCPQIFLGLLVTTGGNPIGYEIFEGNIFEGNTLLPFIENMTQKYHFGKPIIVADSALLSGKNIRILQENGYQYILGARPKNESIEIQNSILGLKLKHGDIVVIEKGNNTKLIVSKTESRAKKDAFNRERGLKRLQKKIINGKLTKAHINNKGYNKYLKMEGEIKISIDMDRYENDIAWDGIKGYITNTELNKEEVIKNYGNLWYIERAFRLSKTDLKVRPIYHRLRNRIEGHICICFTAYTILLELERILKENDSSITLQRAQELTKTMYQLTYQLPQSGQVKNVILKMDPEQLMLYQLVNNYSLS